MSTQQGEYSPSTKSLYSYSTPVLYYNTCMYIKQRKSNIFRQSKTFEKIK